jgi:HSP20 family molecular chaperone IbpA
MHQCLQLGREPLAYVITTDKEVKPTVEISAITKQDIKVTAYRGAVRVSTTEKARRKYHRIIDLRPETKIQTANPLIPMAFWR